MIVEGNGVDPLLRVERLLTRHKIIVLSLIGLLAMALAYHFRFVIDDAYISFRYAKNFSDGHGLVFNPGERTEGYTNFLWTLIMSLPIYFGFEAGRSSIAFGLCIYACTIVATYYLFKRSVGSFVAAAAALLVVVTNFTFACFATGGLETQLQICLFVTATLTTLRLIDKPSYGTGLMLGILSALALLCRLDSGVFLVACYGYLLWKIGWSKNVTVVLTSALIPLTVIVVWSLLRHEYYGAWLPNTFYVKTSGQRHIARGIEYLKLFTLAYFLPLSVLALPVAIIKRAPSAVVMSGIFAVLWFLYILQVGGDFMEFRMGSVVMPFLVAILFWFMQDRGLLAASKIVVVASLIGLSVVNAVKEKSGPLLLSIDELTIRRHDPYGWPAIGEHFKKIFGHNSPVVLGVTAAGAIPYFSEMRSVDMLGLNDKDIAQKGMRTGEWRPGHEIKATIKQLRAKKVNLVLARPQVLSVYKKQRDVPGQFILYHFLEDPDFQCVRDQVRFVLIPIGNKTYTVAWYLTPSAEVDRLIKDGHWPVFPLKDIWLTKQFNKDLSPYGLKFSDFIG